MNQVTPHPAVIPWPGPPPGPEWCAAVLKTQQEAETLEAKNEGPPNRKSGTPYMAEVKHPLSGEVMRDRSGQPVMEKRWPPMWYYVSREQYHGEARRVALPNGLIAIQWGFPTVSGPRAVLNAGFWIVHGPTQQGASIPFGAFAKENSSQDPTKQAYNVALALFFRGFLNANNTDPLRDEGIEDNDPGPGQFAPPGNSRPPAQGQRFNGAPPGAPPGAPQNTNPMTQPSPGRTFPPPQGQQSMQQQPAQPMQQPAQQQPLQGGYQQQRPAQQPQQQGGYQQQPAQQRPMQRPAQQGGYQQQGGAPAPVQGQHNAVGAHPVVQAAHNTFGERSSPPAKAVPVQSDQELQSVPGQLPSEPQGPGQRHEYEPQTADQWRSLLISKGWDTEAATHLSILPPDQEIDEKLRDKIATVAMGHYNNNAQALIEAWKGTGFTPQPGLPPGVRRKPTGVQLLRFCSKIQLSAPASS